MHRMREHVHRTDPGYAILLGQYRQIACLSGRIAAYIYDFLRICIQYHLRHIRMDTCPWWVKDDHIGCTAVLRYKICSEDIFHIPCVECTIGNAVVGCIDLRIFDRLRYILDTYHAGSPCQGRGREFESRFPLKKSPATCWTFFLSGTLNPLSLRDIPQGGTCRNLLRRTRVSPWLLSFGHSHTPPRRCSALPSTTHERPRSPYWGQAAAPAGG